MKKQVYFSLVITIALISLSLPSFSQQEAQFSHNMFNILSYNPAYAGSNNQICLTTLGRQQWMGLSETNEQGNSVNVAPQTFLFSIDGNVDFLRGGFGAVVYKDKLGHEDNIGLKLGYSYKHAIGPGHLSGGIMLGFLNKVIDYSAFNAINENDPLLNGAKESDMIFDMSFGAFYRVPGSFYAGISSSQLLQSESTFPDNLGSPKLKRHYYITGGYNYTLPSMPELELQPSILIKSEFVTAQFDINCLLLWNSQIWGGASYRSTDAVVLFLGGKPFLNSTISSMEALSFGIAYDITTSALGGAGRSFGSAEIMLNYCFEIKIEKPISSYKNVRFL